MEHKTDKAESEHQIIELSSQQKIDISKMYLDEFIHRDGLFWKQAFQWMFITAFVIFFPAIVSFDQTATEFMPVWVFSVAGMLMSGLFIYVGFRNKKHCDAAYLSFEALNVLLPKYAQHKKSPGLGRQKRIGVARLVTCIVFGALFLTSLFSFIYYFVGK